MKTYREFLLEHSQSDILDELPSFKIDNVKCNVKFFKKPKKSEGQSGRTEEGQPHIKIKDGGEEYNCY